MRITAILNLKGGVAKTTTLIELSTILADRGEKVLVIDADPQCNTTNFFEDAGQPLTRSTADILRGENIGAADFAETNYPGVWMIRADDSLMDLDLTKAETGAAAIGFLKASRPFLEVLGYTHVLVDCPPGFNAAAAAALVAADDVVIPMKLDAFSIRGMANLTRQIDNMRRINPDLKIAGILPTMWYDSPQNREAEEAIAKAGFNVYRHIGKSCTVDRMTFAGKPLQKFSKNSGALRNYRGFVGEYLEQEQEAQ